LRQKQETLDPVINRLAGQYGAIFPATARVADGLVVVNVWESPEAAAGFTQLPEVQQAQLASSLPRPNSFERFTDATFADYRG
jgi:hypothetical protein